MMETVGMLLFEMGMMKTIIFTSTGAGRESATGII